MKKFILKTIKKIKEHVLAVKYMRKCVIIEKGRRTVLSKKYMLKDLMSFDCYTLKELKKLRLPELLSLYVGVSTGGTEVYHTETGSDIYVGYIS